MEMVIISGIVRLENKWRSELHLPFQPSHMGTPHKSNIFVLFFFSVFPHIFTYLHTGQTKKDDKIKDGVSKSSTQSQN
jgi:hypothetical protein